MIDPIITPAAGMCTNGILPGKIENSIKEKGPVFPDINVNGFKAFYSTGSDLKTTHSFVLHCITRLNTVAGYVKYNAGDPCRDSCGEKAWKNRISSSI